MKRWQHLASLLLAAAAYVSAAPPAARTQRPAAPRRAPEQQAETKKPEEPGRLPPEVSALIDHARAAPAEFSADALIRVAVSPLVSDGARKRALLEEAFRAAAGAQQPFKRDYVGGNVDTREGYFSYALALKLDALSLRARAVRALLPLDGRKAREMFGEMPAKLPLEPLRCEDALAYDLADFYGALSEVVNNSFGAEERRREEHIRFLEPYVSGINSPAQVPYVAGVLLSLKATPQQFDVLTMHFAGALKHISEDDRSFSTSLWRDALIQRFGELMEANEQRGLPKQSLLAALRTYLVRNLAARRCEDNVRRDRQGLLFNYINSFNKALSEKAISADEIKPAEDGGRYKTYPYWRKRTAAKLLADLKALRFSTGTTPYSAAEKSDPDWRQKLTTFLNDLSDWKGDEEEGEADYFHQKSVLYEALLEVVPPGPARDGVLADFVSFLRDHALRRESRVDWFLHANPLLGHARKAQGGARQKTLELLKNSGDVVLRLYSEIETLLPPRKQDAQ